MADRVRGTVNRLCATGEGDVRKIVGTDDQYRLRVGDYRIRFINEPATEAEETDRPVVLRVLHRREAYRQDR